MEFLLFLLGLAAAASLFMGWAFGLAFVAVMLSLPVGAFLTFDLIEINLEGTANQQNTNYLIGGLIALAIIWAPALVRHGKVERENQRLARRWASPAPQPALGSPGVRALRHWRLEAKD